MWCVTPMTTGCRWRPAGRVGSGAEPAVMPAGDTRSSARSGSCGPDAVGRRRLRRRSVGRPGVRRGGGGAIGLAECLLERLVAEHCALQPGGADLDAEEVEEIVRPERLHVGDWLALDLVGQERRRRLADRAAAAGEPDALDDAILDADLERDSITAQRVAALEARCRRVDDPEVVGPPIVLEDVVAVEVV